MREGVALEKCGSSIGNEYPPMTRSSACSKARDQEETHDAVMVVQLVTPPPVSICTFVPVKQVN
jgi:hypothetical protein